MATGGELLSDIVCPVCLEPYHNPKSLDCGHSLCEACVDKLRNRQRAEPTPRWVTGLGGTSLHAAVCQTAVQCPQCRATTHVPAKGLPTNYQLAEVLTRFSALDTQEGGCSYSICELCQNKLSDDQFWHCITCAAGNPQNRFCSKCGLKLHNGHSTVEISELKERKAGLAAHVGQMRQETYPNIEKVRTNTGLVVEFANSLIQTLEQNATKKFDKLLENVTVADICNTGQLEKCQNEAVAAKNSVNHMCSKILESQANTILTLQSALEVVDGEYTSAQIVEVDASESQQMDSPRQTENVFSPVSNPLPTSSSRRYARATRKRQRELTEQTHKHTEDDGEL